MNIISNHHVCELSRLLFRLHLCDAGETSTTANAYLQSLLRDANQQGCLSYHRA